MDNYSYDYRQAEGIPEVAIRIALLERRLSAQLPVGRILEVGVGAGDVTLMLSRAFLRPGHGTLACVDASAANVAHTRSRLAQAGLPEPDFLVGTIEAAALPGVFDHIVLLGLLEHLADPVAVLRKLAGILAQNGRVHVVVNLASSIHRWLGVEMGQIQDVEALSESDQRLGHYRVYSLPLLREHLAQAGFRILVEDPFYLKPLPTSMLNALPMELHQGLESLGRRFPEFASYVRLEAEVPHDCPIPASRWDH